MGETAGDITSFVGQVSGLWIQKRERTKSSSRATASGGPSQCPRRLPAQPPYNQMVKVHVTTFFWICHRRQMLQDMWQPYLNTAVTSLSQDTSSRFASPRSWKLEVDVSSFVFEPNSKTWLP